MANIIGSPTSPEGYGHMEVCDCIAIAETNLPKVVVRPIMPLKVPPAKSFSHTLDP